MNSTPRQLAVVTGASSGGIIADRGGYSVARL
jgi:hypothetical protein